MQAGDRAKLRRHQAQAAQARREAGAATDDVARQQLLEHAGKDQRAATKIKKKQKTVPEPTGGGTD